MNDLDQPVMVTDVNVEAYGSGGTDSEPAVFTGAFGGAIVADDVYTFPTGAESFAGFANDNGALYPFSFPSGGEITFTASVPDAGPDTTIQFVFERLPFPDVDPSFSTELVVISGSTDTEYTVAIPAQDAVNTYSSFLLYVRDLDQPVRITDVVVTTF